MLVRSYPFADLFTLERDLDRLVDRTFGLTRATAAAAVTPFAVVPDAEGVTVRAELPGVDPASISLTAENHVLTISAQRNAEKHDNAHARVQERRYGTYTQSLRLADDLDAAAITATAEHGVLTVRIPKRAEAKPRQIAVKVS